MNNLARFPSLLVISITFLTLGVIGCGKSKPVGSTGGPVVRETPDPWPRAVTAIRKEPEFAVCRRELNELNAALASRPASELPPAMPAETEASIKSLCNLIELEWKEIRSTSFTPLDAHYLAECLYLRDVARTLDVASFPPARRAQIAWEWVCRQVTLRPWVVPLSATHALRRGAGSGLDRAYVFILLCRQLDLDAYLIGPDDAGDRKAAHIPAGRKEPKGPFWAVGVRDGEDILLYEPWRGQAIPGPTPGRPATLAEVRAKPEVAFVWLDNTAHVWDVRKEDLKVGEPYLVVPNSSFATRMQLSEEKFRSEIGVKLHTDWPAYVANAQKAAKGAKLHGWWPTNDTFSLGRVLQAYISVVEGGTGAQISESGAVSTASDLFTTQLVPIALFNLNLPGLTNPAVQRFLLNWRVSGTYVNIFLKSPTPLERTQRGQFSDAAKYLVGLRDDFVVRAEQYHSDPQREQVLKNFSTAITDFYNQDFVPQAQTRGKSQSEIEQSVMDFAKTNQQLLAIAMLTILEDAISSESTYLLAVNTQERAEKLTIALERAQMALAKASPSSLKNATKARDDAKEAARDAWGIARNWWGQYEPYAAKQDVSYPGRAAHAKAMTERSVQQLASLQ